MENKWHADVKYKCGVRTKSYLCPDLKIASEFICADDIQTWRSFSYIQLATLQLVVC